MVTLFRLLIQQTELRFRIKLVGRVELCSGFLFGIKRFRLVLSVCILSAVLGLDLQNLIFDVV